MNIYEKLMAIQTELKAPKNLVNSFGEYRYRNAEGIMEAVKPYLKKYGCALTLEDEVVQQGERYYIVAYAKLHNLDEEGGCVRTSAWAREAEEKKKLDVAQVTGAASSYARKYALNGLFILDDTKDPDTDESYERDGRAEEFRNAPAKKSDIQRLNRHAKEAGMKDCSELKCLQGITKLEEITFGMYLDGMKELGVQ